MKKTLFILLCTLFLTACCNTSDTPTPQQKEMNRFVSELMKQMTVEEKIGQLHLISGNDFISGENVNTDSNRTVREVRKGKVGAFINAKGVSKIRELQRIAVEESRMKIPLMFGMDFLHGYETIFPIPLGMAASWNMDNIEKATRIAAVEASADGLNWVYSPMVDISRDPRWGRVSEGAGEDPFLGGEIARAQVKGYQGNPAYAGNTDIMACVKHFGLYGASEAGRDYSVVDMSEQRARNDYLYPYKAAVEAGVGSVMSSFNEINGMPATANKWLLNKVLREEWGFNGFVVTDYASINDITRFGMGGADNAAVLSLKAGTDMDMESYAYYHHLQKALENGNVTMADIDNACRRILEAKYKLGLFADPYKYCDTSRPARDIYNRQHRAEARKIAAETFVLLKNDGNILPLKKQGTVALIGPHGNNRPNMLGSWGWPSDINKAATLLEGMTLYLDGKAKVLYAKGCRPYEDMTHEDILSLTKDFEKDNRSENAMLKEALQIARQADVIIATLGESSEMSGESSSRSDINIPAPQQRLLKALAATGKPVILVLFTGRPLTITWENKHVPAILNVWFPGTEAACAIPDVLFGDVNPSGKLTSTWAQNAGQIPIYYNIKNVSKPLEKWPYKFRSGYLDVSNEPLYPFGYGLSYTKFLYGTPVINDTVMRESDTLTVTVSITNSGQRDGAETVQFYIRDIVASTVRPNKELKGFCKIFLKAGEIKEVKFKITSSLLKFYDYDLNCVCEKGAFEAMVGRNSADLQKVKFTLL